MQRLRMHAHAVSALLLPLLLAFMVPGLVQCTHLRGSNKDKGAVPPPPPSPPPPGNSSSSMAGVVLDALIPKAPKVEFKQELSKLRITGIRTKTGGYLPSKNATSSGGSTGGGHGAASAYWPGANGYCNTVSNAGNIAVMTDYINVYPMFYGPWSNADMDAIKTFILSLSDTSADASKPSVRQWWARASSWYTWYNNGWRNMASRVTLQTPLIYNTLWKGSWLNSAQNDDVFYLLSMGMYYKNWPVDPNGIYVLFTSPEVKIGPSGFSFCQNFCGWHSWKSYSNQYLKYTVVGNPATQCPGACGATANVIMGSNSYSTATGNFGADSLISTLAHELVETGSDPWTDSRAWGAMCPNNQFMETADLCAWRFLDTKWVWVSNKWALYNLQGIRGYKYLVQTLPNPSTQTCVTAGV